MRWLVASCAALLMTSASAMANTAFPVSLQPVDYSDLPGWAEDDHEAAMTAFRRTCETTVPNPPRTRSNGVDGAALAYICTQLRESPMVSARAFFETHFEPYHVVTTGLLTGYFEPQVAASFTRTGPYQYPIYARPNDLVELPASAEQFGITENVTWARRVEAGYQAFPDRQAIMNGALDGLDLELAYLADPLDVFFIHIQGSARLAMTDGSVQRINFAGKSGHDYTPIGRTLVERGLMALEDVTMDSLRAWLDAASPEDQRSVLVTNRSYIFFTMAEETDPHMGPIAAAGAPLTPGRSLAVDRHLHTFGTPIFLNSTAALPGNDESLSRLTIAQDTGSAIVGAARGDIFIGSGEQAGSTAGSVNQPVTFTLLRPRTVE